MNFQHKRTKGSTLFRLFCCCCPPLYATDVNSDVDVSRPPPLSLHPFTEIPLFLFPGNTISREVAIPRCTRWLWDPRVSVEILQFAQQRKSRKSAEILGIFKALVKHSVWLDKDIFFVALVNRIRLSDHSRWCVMKGTSAERSSRKGARAFTCWWAS